jgi:hypothetical protein
MDFPTRAVKSNLWLFGETLVLGRFFCYLVVPPGLLEDSYRVSIALASRA